jgi:2-dehydrotetronate isomerase
MRFSANLGFLWADRPLPARIEAAARAGFRAVEMHWPYDVPASDVAAAARHWDVTLLGINTAPGNFAAGERGLGAIPGREQDFQGTVDQSIEYCRSSGYRAHIGHVQIASVPARAEPDEGEIAYPVIFAALEKLEYHGWVGCEYRPRGDTDQGLDWMDRMGMR